MVSTGSNQEVYHLLCIGRKTVVCLRSFRQSICLQSSQSRLLVVECCKIGMANRILIGKSFQILGSCLCRYLWHVCLLWRRHNVKGITITESLAHPAIQANRYLLVLAKRCFGKAISSVLRSPNHHVALACREEGLAIGIRILGHHAAKLCVVVYLEVHSRPIHWLASLIHNIEVDAGGRGIVVDEIDFGIVGGAQHHLLGTIVVAERLGVHQHATRYGGVKPCQVEHSLWFASPKKVPLAVCPSLHPSVVVIGMSPTWGVNLACRDAYRSQRSYGKSTLLATSSEGRTNSGERSRGAGIGRLIGNTLVAPMVHLQDGILHAHPLHSFLQLTEEYLARIV